jgi:HEAT repeat protein
MRCGWFWLRSSLHTDLIVLAVGLIKHEENNISRAATELLVDLVTRDDLSLIVGMLNDENWKVRYAAAEAFGKLGNHDDLSFIAGMLKDQNAAVRGVAAETLAKLAAYVDAEGLLDLVSEGSQGWDSIARSHYEALCLLDRKFYCPILPDE